MIGAFDVEASDWTRFLVAGTLVEGERAPRFHRSARALYDYMAGHPCRVWYAHNFGGYDAMFLLPELAREPDLVLTPQGDGSSLLRAQTADLDLRDSIRILRASLAKVGEALGRPKGSIPYRRIRELWATAAGRRRILDYLARDLDVLLSGLLTMRDEVLHVEQLPLTLAGHGARLVRDAGYPALTVPEADRAVLESYCGGRVEVIRVRHPATLPALPPPEEDRAAWRRLPRARIERTDVNASYPRSWAGGLPAEYLGTTRRPTTRTAFVRARVTLPRHVHLPGLPVRMGGKLMFPVGELRGLWDAGELDRATSGIRGAAVRVVECLNFTRSEVPAAWAREVWEARARATGFLCLALKWLANETTGKLAEREVRYALFRRGDRPLTGGSGVIPWKLTGNPHRLYLRRIHSEPTMRNVAGASHTNADARVRWLDAALRCSEVFYGDTDSLDSEGFPRDLVGDGLGQWKREGTNARAWWWLPKLYLLDDGRERTAKARGFSRLPEGDDEEGTRGLGADDLRALARGAAVPVSGVWKFRSALRREDLAPRIARGEKRLRHAYNKRRVLEDGVSTAPWTVDEAREILSRPPAWEPAEERAR